jgi:hypothetical protein
MEVWFLYRQGVGRIVRRVLFTGLGNDFQAAGFVMVYQQA